MTTTGFEALGVSADLAAALAAGPGGAGAHAAGNMSDEDLKAGLAPAGIEYYLPLFFENTATFIDYFPRDAVVALHGDVDAAIDRFWQDTESRYRLLRGDPARPLLPPLRPRSAGSTTARPGSAAPPSFRSTKARSCPTSTIRLLQAWARSASSWRSRAPATWSGRPSFCTSCRMWTGGDMDRAAAPARNLRRCEHV